MPVTESPAIVTKISDYSETSVIADFFTRNCGLVRCIFKGARRKTKAYTNNIDLLASGKLAFYERKSGLNIVNEFISYENHSGLHKDLERYKAALACLEFVRYTVVESETDTLMFDLFQRALKACSEDKFPWPASYSFITSGLSVAGFAPDLNKCISCSGREFPKHARARTAFSYKESGILCMKCGRGPRVEDWLTKDALNTLTRYLDINMQKGGEVKLDKATAIEVRGFLRRYCEFTFERPFRMLK